MSQSSVKHRLELPPEAEPARAFIEALVEDFEKQIRELEERVEKLTPRNSSIPPSSEHPHGKPKRKPSPGKKRKQGGQKGHAKQVRKLLPAEECDSVQDCLPDACRRCGGEVQVGSTEPLRHQVWELPPIKPIVNEFRLHRGHCSKCGITTCGSLPKGVPNGQCGPRLAAFAGLLMHEGHRLCTHAERPMGSTRWRNPPQWTLHLLSGSTCRGRN